MKSLSAMILASLTLGLAGIGHSQEQTVEPVERSIDRYTHIWTAKPFVAATVVSPQAESLAQRYAITGYGQFGGQDVLFLLDRVSLNRFTISGTGEENGVALVEVSDKSDANRLKARVRIAGEVTELVYDPGTAALGMPGGENAALANNIPNIQPTGAAPAPQVAPAQLSQQPNVNRRTGAPRPVRVIQRREIRSQ